MKIKVLDLIDFEKVDNLLEGFNQSTGFVTAILDLEGNVLSKSGWRQVCTEFHRINPETSKRCTISDTILAGKLAAGEKYHFYKCLNGLVDVAVPIVIKGEHIANLFSGQFFFEEPDEVFFKEQAKKYGFDEDSYLKALAKVPVIPEEKVKSAMNFLLNMTQLISEMTFQKLEQMELNEELRTSEERFRAYINQAADALFVHNFSGQIIDVNPQACKNLGYSREELLNMSVFDLELDFDLPSAQEAWSKIQPNQPFILLGHQRRKDGSIFPVEVQFGCFDLGGKRYYMGIARDITDRKQAEIELRENELKFRNYIDFAPHGVFVADENGNYVEVNFAASNITGYGKDELLSMNLVELFPEESLELVGQHFERVVKEGYASGEFPFIRKDKSIGYWIVEAVKLSDKRFLGFVVDISQRNLTEKNLRESEEKYRFMFNNNPQPNYIFDLKTLMFLEVNEAAIIHYGFSKKEFLSMTLKDIRPQEDISALLEHVKLSDQSLKDISEWRHIKKNGELIYVEIISHTVNFDGRDARHVLVHDITDRKLAEEALKRANTELKNLHNNLDEAVFSVDMIHDKTLYASVAHQTVFGRAPAEFINNPQLWFEIIVPEDKSIFVASLPILASGKNICLEYRISHPNREIHWIEDKINPTLDENGILTRIDGVSYDITNRKQVETELLESEINFRRSISESPVGIRIVSVDGDTVYANKAFLDMFEFKSLDEFTATPAIKRYITESYVQHRERKNKRKNGVDESDYEISIICKNEEIRHIKVSRKEVLWNGMKHFQVINLNITEQRKAEEELRKLSIAVEQSPNAECITDPNGIIEYVNPITIKLTGYTQEELLGQKSSIFSSGEKPKEEYAELWEIIKSGNVWCGELHNKKKNGELYWESATISPIFDNQGKITHFLAIKVDITERKRAEEALNNSQLELRKFATHLQNVREEEKISLAREIHDDLAQISVALKIDLGIFERKLSKGIEAITSEELLSKLKDFSGQVDNSIKSARRIINGLRPELIELLGFEDACKSYLLDFEKTHHISTQFESTISNLNIDLKQSVALFRILQEALNNIIKHAKATLVTVQLTNSTGKLVMVIVDNGVGFDENNKGRQDSYGLIGMKERIFLLEGSLDITSKVGKGTSVRVEIPY